MSDMGTNIQPSWPGCLRAMLGGLPAKLKLDQAEYQIFIFNNHSASPVESCKSYSS